MFRSETEATTTDRKAFRLCINADNRDRLLDAAAWPDFILISEWYFKSHPSDDDKCRHVDSQSNSNVYYRLGRTSAAGGTQAINAASALQKFMLRMKIQL